MGYKPLALINGPFFHHLDHLAPLAYFFECPLFVDDSASYALGKNHYPQVEIHHVETDWMEIAKHYNLLLLSTRYATSEIRAIYHALGITHMRYCFCPHGHSDKNMEIYEGQDIALIYGNKQLGRLNHPEGVHIIGNYRLVFHERFRKTIDLFPQKQKTILYAPTWTDNETSTTFFLHWKELLEKLPSHYNLILKLHPLLEKHHPSHAWEALSYDQVKPNVRVILALPEIYPLLENVDIYLGDYSAVGYDFLHFNRPMFFLAKETRDLHQCGKVVPTVDAFLSHIEDPQTLLHPIRKAFYEDAFSPFF